LLGPYWGAIGVHDILDISLKVLSLYLMPTALFTVCARAYDTLYLDAYLIYKHIVAAKARCLHMCRDAVFLSFCVGVPVVIDLTALKKGGQHMKTCLTVRALLTRQSTAVHAILLYKESIEQEAL
jgi:hypothetical protein